jgi:hypothetical protein
VEAPMNVPRTAPDIHEHTNQERDKFKVALTSYLPSWSMSVLSQYKGVECRY